ncbi:hypothetical protein EW145_g7108, partial [Phellinidium pouzarii]
SQSNANNEKTLSEGKSAKIPKRKAKANPIVSGPSFTLPDTSEPLPPNFLRNQQALLGLAGVVGGINPAHLSTRSSRGATAYNPIIVEEEAPSISSTAWKSRQAQLPSHMPVPSGEAIANTLVSQGNIFPVIRSLMPYFGGSSNVGCCAGHDCHPVGHDTAHSHFAAPPLKRRKLNSVPAGAKDWDVPYPFPNNEGPTRYFQKWEKTRGKKLVLELVSLVRDAVQKAAAKSYFEEKGKEKEENPEMSLTCDDVSTTGDIGRTDISTSQSAHDTTADQRKSNSAPALEYPPPQPIYPDILASSDRNASSSTQELGTDFEAFLDAVNTALTDSNVQLTNDDLAVMSSFGLSPTSSCSPSLVSSTRLSTPIDITEFSTSENKENTYMESLFSQFPCFGNDNIPPDPALLDVTWPSSASAQNQLFSPYAASSSEFIANAPTVADFQQASVVPHRLDSPENSLVNIPTYDNQSDRMSSTSGTHISTSLTPTTPSTFSQTSFFALEHPPAPSHASVPQRQVRNVRSVGVRTHESSNRQANRKLEREDVRLRAHVRREQLATEVARAKIELWETTIEQGVLINLSKDKRHWEDLEKVKQAMLEDDEHLGSSQCSQCGSAQANEDVPLLGAPIEKKIPLGYEVTLLSCAMLNLGEMLGSGIFSVPGVILNSVGSIGMFFLAWTLAPVFAAAGLSLYSELGSMFPNRSGAEVVYLEQAYPRPRSLVPVSFAVTTASFSSSCREEMLNNYVSLAVVAFSTKWSLRAVNTITAIKILSQILVISAGIAVLAGVTHIEDPWSNFADPWAGSTFNGNALATAFVKTHFAFVGWNNSFNVLAEVRGRDPVRTVRNSGRISLAIVTVLFLLTNIAYIAAIPKDDIKHSGQLVGALFFQRVFGNSWAAKILPIAVTVGKARVIREIARQGLLPWPDFFASTKPFGTPLGPVLMKYTLTVIVILAVPAADAFSFLLDLFSYPNLFFSAATAIGVWILRRRHSSEGIQPSKYKSSNVSIILYLASCISLIVMPWIPPEKGQADVSFWYATYCVVGIAIILACGVYYYVWIVLLPSLGGYEVVEEVEELAGGARLARLVRRRLSRAQPSLVDEQENLL